MTSGVLAERLAVARAARLSAGALRRLSVSEHRAPGRIVVDGKERIDFSSNDYLGLAHDPRLVAALRRGANQYGFGAGAAHLLGGHCAAHHELEELLADWVGRPKALLFSSGWAAAIGAISALLQERDDCFQDKLNHACLIDGAMLSAATLRRYPHLDVEGLRRQYGAAHAQAAKSRARSKPARLTVTDAVFSMDGDVAPLGELALAASQHGSWLMVDEAHALGVRGPQGAGLCRELALGGERVQVLMGTLGKALGAYGAFIAGGEALIEHLVNHARSFVYSTAPPPALAVATAVAVDIVRQEGWRRERLDAVSGRLRRHLLELGFSIGACQGPIFPLLLGGVDRTVQLAGALAEAGIHAPAIRPPTVPRAASRLRISLSADHTPADVDRLAEALRSALPRLGPPDPPET